MESTQGEETQALFQAQAHIWKHLFNFINSMSLKCAVQLGIPDIIHNHGRPIALSDLVSALQIPGTKTTYVRRLMRILVHSGFFATQTIRDQAKEEEGYLLTPSSRLLLKEETTSIAPFLLMMLDPVLLTPWNFMSAWFLQGTEPTPFEATHGMSLFNYAGKSPELNNFFSKAMACDTRLVMGEIVTKCGSVFQGLKSLVDVGGGTGTAAKAIADGFPEIKCTVLDLPHVVAGLPEDPKVDFMGGDMFESIPQADAIFLKWTLHAYSDEACVKILRRCKEAIPRKEEGGKVIVVEMVVNDKGDHESTETQLFFDMLMMVESGGMERDEQQWCKILSDAGFSDYKITPILGVRSIIEAYY